MQNGARAGTISENLTVRRQLETVMPEIAATLAHVISVDSCAFYVYDETATRTIAAFRHGQSKVYFPKKGNMDESAPQSIAIEAELLRTRRTIRRFTDDDFQRWPMINEFLRERARRYSDIAVPLVWHDTVHGVVYLWRRGSTVPFTDDEIAVAEALAQIAAMAVDYARRYGVEWSQRQRLDALLKVASLASSSSTVEEVLRHLAEAVTSSIGADICNLYLFDETGDSVLEAYSVGLNEMEQWVFDASDSYPVSVIPAEVRAGKTLAPVIVTDPESDLAPGSELIIYAREAGLAEILIVPIVYQSQMIGVIYSWYRDARQMFDDESVAVVRAIANQAGGVVTRARLHEATQQHSQETEALRRIGEAVLTSDAMEPVLDEIASVLNTIISFDYAFVALLDQGGESVTIIRHWGKFPESLLHQRLQLDASLTGYAVATGELVNIPDAHADDRAFVYETEYLPIRSVLVAPLITERGRIGALYLGRHASGSFSRRQEQVMSLLSQHAAAAIERIQARDALALHTKRQSFLASVVDRLAATPDPRTVLTEIAEMSCGVLADGMAIALSSWEYGKIEWAGSGFLDSSRSTELRDLLEDSHLLFDCDEVERLLASDGAVRVPTGEIDRLVPRLSATLEKLQIFDVMVVPMRRQNRAPGLLFLLKTPAGHALSQDVLEITEVVASRIGDALERRQMSRNREALLRVSEAMNRRLDFDQMLEMFAAELNEIVPYDQMYLGELDRDGRHARPLIYSNPLGLSAEDVADAANNGLLREAIRNQSPVMDNQAHQSASSRYASTTEADYYSRQGESALAAPLIAGGEVIGAMFIGRTGAHRFSDSDFETFLLFAGLVATAVHRNRLVEHRRSIYRASIEVLAAIVDARDSTTYEHARDVARYSRDCARLLELSPEEVERVELAGLLHDIGKLSIPDYILGKSSPLTEDEEQILLAHPERGAEILAQHPALTDLVPLIRHQNESFNGTGYPDGLRGREIPIGASIIGVADAFASMISGRGSQRDVPVDEALDELDRLAGIRFRPQVVEQFARGVRHGTIGLAKRDSVVARTPRYDPWSIAQPYGGEAPAADFFNGGKF